MVQAGRSRALAVRGPDVAHETLDDESVIVDLRSGTYYSLRGAAAQIWQWSVDGCSIDSVVAAALARFDAPADAVSSAVERVIDELIEAGLLVVTADDGGDVADGERTAFVEPSVEAFRDLEELLTLDPIHDVGPSGWPSPAPGA